MKEILALIDFTPASEHCLKQAIYLAQANNYSICLCHVSKSYYGDVPEELKAEMKPFEAKLKEAGIDYSVQFGQGDLYSEVAPLVEERGTKLVMVATHGKRGLKQNLFGANIHKLVKHIPVTTLVLSLDSPLAEKAFQKVLLPIAPHDDILVKVEACMEVAGENAQFDIFTVLKSGQAIDEKLKSNLSTIGSFLDEKGLSWNSVEHETDQFSIGYSTSIIDYAASNGYDLVAVMTDVSAANRHYGNVDKESLLINDKGLQILSARA